MGLARFGLKNYEGGNHDGRGLGWILYTDSDTQKAF